MKTDKQLKDYLHLYMGCECKVYMPTIDFELPFTGTITVAMMNTAFRMKPILRPLSDMTEQECFELSEIFGWQHLSKESRIAQVMQLFNKNGFFNRQTNIHGNEWAKATVKMLSYGIDLFCLIESGLAIDKTKLATPSAVDTTQPPPQVPSWGDYPGTL